MIRRMSGKLKTAAEAVYEHRRGTGTVCLTRRRQLATNFAPNCAFGKMLALSLMATGTASSAAAWAQRSITAAAMDAYVMSDRATWVAFKNRQNLTLLFEGDDVLFNQYGQPLRLQRKNTRISSTIWLRSGTSGSFSGQGQKAIARLPSGRTTALFP